MFAPALNLELSQLDVATLCALHSSEHAATWHSHGEEAGGQAPLDLSLPWTFAVAVLFTLAGTRFLRRQRNMNSSVA